MPDLVCPVCSTDFHRKPSQLKRFDKFTPTCSVTCRAKLMSKLYLGTKNPNYKNRNVTDGGYLIHPPNAVGKYSSMKIHQAVVCEALDIVKVTEGVHIHHRDCNILNNAPDNLLVISPKYHVWLHKQFGNATLWAIYNNKISIDEVVNWSDNRPLAKKLLQMTLEHQVNIVKAFRLFFPNVEYEPIRWILESFEL